MRILHIASFNGNIGDNASHLGFASILNKSLAKYSVTQVEIRKFYKNYIAQDKMSFDESFVEFANSFDQVIVGGGGFLDYWVPNSATGTTIDIKPSLLRTFKTKVLFTSIGCNPHKEVPEGNIEKIRNFFDEVIATSNVKIMFRNDGSLLSVASDIGEQYLDYFSEILDHGFFFDSDPNLPDMVKRNYIAVNVTNDQLSMKSRLHEAINRQSYVRSFQIYLETIVANHGSHFVFVPHIFGDLGAITEIVSGLPDHIIRNHVSIAPCLQGDSGARTNFNIYKRSDLVLGSRFHANVCSLAMGKPVIGLSILDRVRYIFDQFEISDNCVDATEDMAKQLLDRHNRLIGLSEVQNKILEKKSAQTLSFYRDYFASI